MASFSTITKTPPPQLSLPCSCTTYQAHLFTSPVPVSTSTSSIRRRGIVSLATNRTRRTNSLTRKSNKYAVGDFMTKKEKLHVVKTTTPVDDALEALVEKGVTGLPVIDDDWTLVGVVSDYDLLALDSISGGGQSEGILFPDVGSTWKTFNEIRKLLGKTYGKTVGDLMTPNPLVVVHAHTNLEDAARLMLETRYHRLPVVDDDDKLIGIITRGDIVRAGLQIKRATKSSP